jgi:hypothetical protein
LIFILDNTLMHGLDALKGWLHAHRCLHALMAVFMDTIAVFMHMIAGFCIDGWLHALMAVFMDTIAVFEAMIAGFCTDGSLSASCTGARCGCTAANASCTGSSLAFGPHDVVHSWLDDTSLVIMRLHGRDGRLHGDAAGLSCMAMAVCQS